MSDEKTIIRVEKDPDNPFVMMDKRPLNNVELTWGAKGLLAYLLSKPDNWKVIKSHLLTQAPDGRKALDGLFAELKEAGHLTWTQGKNKETGEFEQGWKVHERPVPQKGYTGKGVTPKGTSTKTDVTKTEEPTAPDGAVELPLDWKIALGQPVTDSDLAASSAYAITKQEAQDSAWLVAQTDADLQGFAVAFILARQILPADTKQTLSKWRAALREMKQARPKPVQAEHVTQAVKKLLADDMTVDSPRAVVKTAISLANPAPTVVTDDSRTAASPMKVKVY